MPRARSLQWTWVLPILMLLISEAMVLIPTIGVYKYLKTHVQANGSISIHSATFRAEIPENRFLPIALQIASMQAQRTVTVIQAPGQLVHVAVSRAVAQTSNWYPRALGASIWRVLAFPFYALPGWVFVGRGLDALLGRKRLYKAEMPVSFFLAVLFLAISVALRFGLTEAERGSQELLQSYIFGFALWCPLIALPGVAWFRQARAPNPALQKDKDESSSSKES